LWTPCGGVKTDDDEAVARACAGDLDAYSVLVARYSAVAHRTAYFLGAGEDAKDVVQEAFVKGFRGLKSFRDGAAFRPWILRIVANETGNLRRSRRRRGLLELRVGRMEETVDHRDPASVTLVDARRTALLDAVRTLPDKDRLVVTCRYLLDLTEAETAQTLGLAKGTVKSRLSRALAKLRPLLEGVVADD
jgi:RNA polymerase sigma factor (sigma-70 family)